MLIPRFSLAQTATDLNITVRCPYVKFSASNDDSNGIEVDVSSSDEFYFACKPYYLHLYLPGRIVDKNCPDYTYDVETSSFCFTYEKETAHEHFDNLDMMTRLLHKAKPTTSNIIEEIDRAEANDHEDDDDEPLWNQMAQLEIEGEIVERMSKTANRSCFAVDQPNDELISSSSYGFNRQYKEIFSHFDAEYALTFDNPSPDQLAATAIRTSRWKKEQADFDPEHYIVDQDEFTDDEDILNYQLVIDDQLDDEDRDDLKNLKYKQLLIDDSVPIYLGLIDILYAFAYDQRITQYVSRSNRHIVHFLSFLEVTRAVNRRGTFTSSRRHSRGSIRSPIFLRCSLLAADER